MQLWNRQSMSKHATAAETDNDERRMQQLASNKFISEKNMITTTALLDVFINELARNSERVSLERPNEGKSSNAWIPSSKAKPFNFLPNSDSTITISHKNRDM
jgi:hypothetical protein